MNNSTNKSKLVALLLCLFFGYFGLHRFYLDKKTSGKVWLCTLGLLGIGWVIDTITLTLEVFSGFNGTPTQQVATTQTTTGKTTQTTGNTNAYVFIAENGKKYHLNPNCGGLKNSQRILLNQAKGKGYTVCERCRFYQPYF